MTCGTPGKKNWDEDWLLYLGASRSKRAKQLRMMASGNVLNVWLER
jgi:hypothetical protein